jgi:hypothetical protein
MWTTPSQTKNYKIYEFMLVELEFVDKFLLFCQEFLLILLCCIRRELLCINLFFMHGA